MPIYEYRCQSCEDSFEALVSIKDPQAECPNCGGYDLARELSTFASGVGADTSVPQTMAAAPRACCGGGCGCH